MRRPPVWVIVNPAAGRGRAARLWPVLAAELRRRGLDYTCELTSGPRGATELTRRALHAGAETIVAVGGDGTVNEVVNGFFSREAPVHPTASLAVVPAGSACDLARNLGIPAATGALELLAAGRTRPVDVGRVTLQQRGRAESAHFLINADVGIGARITQQARRFRRAGPRGSFFLGSAVALARTAPWSGELVLDGERSAVRAISVAVASGSYTGGGMQLAPGARLDDGLFDVVTIGAMPLPALLANLLRIYSGGHLRDPRIRLVRARHVQVLSAGRPPIQIDGEVLGEAPAEFTVLPGAIRLHAP